MPNDRDVIQVVPATHDLEGKPLEPEERPAQRIQSIPTSLSLGDQVVSMEMPGEVIFEATAGELAAGMRTACATCKHFDQLGWRQLYKDWSHSSDESKRRFVQECRRVVADTQDLAVIDAHLEQGKDVPDALAGIDVEHALLNGFGLCRAMTEIFSAYAGEPDVKIVHLHAKCPDMNGPGGENLRHLYQPRDRRAATGAANAYDNILKMALGEKPNQK